MSVDDDIASLTDDILRRLDDRDLHRTKESPVFRPLNDHVLIELDTAEATSKGGIILPDISKEKPVTGKVVAVGPGKVYENGVRVPLDVWKGNRVLFSKYAAVEIKIDGRTLTTVRESDILGTLE
jgi:chaperonin GroES